MSYLVLARKWRPQTFDEVAGQEVIVKTLRQALLSQRLAHAFLFSGSRGTGKTTLARILAKALCCEKGISPDPCGRCTVCQSIADGSSMDIIEIDGASNTGVDDVRELKESIRYQPGQARFKVIIIDEVHMLSTNAFNALLKTLEEPPPHVKFILATTEPHKIPVTIHSRCQRYDFRRLKSAVICEQLNRILTSEGLSIDQDGLRLIAQVADGGMRDALSLTDQVLSFAPENASLADVSSLLGVSSRKAILDMTLALLERDVNVVFKRIDEMEASGLDLRRAADDLALEIRNLALSRVTGTVRGLVDLSEDEIVQIDQIAQRFEVQDLQRVFTLMLDGIDQVARSEQARMSLELIALRIVDRPSAESLLSISQSIARLEALSQTHLKRAPASLPAAALPVATPSMPAPIPTPAPASALPTPAPARAPTPTPTPTSVVPKRVSIEPKWVEFVKAVAKVNASIAVYLEHGRPKSDASVSFEHRFYRDRILEVAKEDWFVETIERVYGKGASISWNVDETERSNAMSIHEVRSQNQKNAQAQMEQNARSHPAVKKALALFGGEIKAVKPTAPKNSSIGSIDESGVESAAD